MLKISKISKVILASCLLMVFSAIMSFDGVAYANEDPYAKCVGKKGADKRACVAAIDAANDAKKAKETAKTAANNLTSSAGKQDEKTGNYVLETKTSTDRYGNATITTETSDGVRIVSDSEGKIKERKTVTKDDKGNVITITEENFGSKKITQTRDAKGNLVGGVKDGFKISDGNIEAVDDKAGAWDTALAQKNNSQTSYNSASVAYNKCVAINGSAGCVEEEKALKAAKEDLEKATKNYNDAQEQASKDYYKNQKAQAKAEKAQAKADKAQKKADEKNLKAKQKAYNKCVKEKGEEECSEEKGEMDQAQATVDAYSDVEKSFNPKEDPKLEELEKELDDAKGYGGQSDVVNKMKAYSANAEQAAKAAEAECARYSAMTSKDAQAKAQAACAQAVNLRDIADKAAKAYFNANKKLKDSVSKGVIAAEGRLNSLGSADMSGGEGKKFGVVDINNSREIGITGGHNSLVGYRGGFDYEQGAKGEVLDKVTRRAALVIVSLKPIVFIFAGFGLIAFAWMAIFNKISWKWFANIAMGLFLVANMGRLIEYFVAGDGNYHYYIGKWENDANSVGKQTDGQNQLANAFKDSYYVYGDIKVPGRGLHNFNEAAAGDSESTLIETFKPSAAGFCQGTSASGWANFKNCMQDIVATAKKVGDTVKTAKATVQDVVARAESLKDNYDNIIQAAKAMEGASLTDIVANAGTILNNVNAAVSTTTGAVGSIQNGMSSIANNVQDMGKSRAQQQELNDRRSAGEATNKFNAKLSGQEWNESTKGVENVDGKYAGQDTGWSKFAQGAANVSNKTSETNAMAQDLLAKTQAVTNVVDNTSVNDLIGHWGQKWGNKTLNDEIKESSERKKQEKYLKTNEGKIDNYQKNVKALDGLSSNLKNLNNEKDVLEKQKTQAQEQMTANCQPGSEDSELCKASKDLYNSLNQAVSTIDKQISDKEGEYNAIKGKMDGLYEDALEGHIGKAQDEYKDAKDDAEKICKKAPSSQECYAAKQKMVDAANKVVAYTNEKEKGTKESKINTKEENNKYNESKYNQELKTMQDAIKNNAEKQEMKRAEEQLKYEQEQADYRQNNEASIAQQEYSKAMDEANTLYTQINAQEKEAKDLEEQAKAKQQEATKICGSNASSQLCATAQTAASAAKDAADNKKDQLNQSKQQYNDAKGKAEAAYNNAVAAGANQAQRDYDKAKSAAEEAKKQIDDAQAKMGDAKTKAETSKAAYETAVSNANKAKSDYEEAIKNGASATDIETLKNEYDTALKNMSSANKERQKAENEYNQLQKQKAEAEAAYNNAYSKANEAADKKASYTNESVNKTGESRLNSTEDAYNQALVNQYKTETNPNAMAQASRNSYVEYKNKTDMAKSVMTDTALAVEQARIAYEAAQAAAKASGSEEDQKIADRMKKSYELAKVEAENAKKEYEKNIKNLPAYEADYINKAIASEKYKMEVYNAQMQKASTDINTYEKQVNTQRQVVDAAGDEYIKAKNLASDNNPDSVKNAAIKYNEYKAKKEIYDDYVRKLNLAKNSYSAAQSGYQSSLAEIDRLEKQLKELKGVSN